MEWDHLPGTEKTLVMSNTRRCAHGRARILAEIAKCELVCANCHRERTFGDAEDRAGLEAQGRTRTGDPSFTRAVLYQLSYLGETAADQCRAGMQQHRVDGFPLHAARIQGRIAAR